MSVYTSESYPLSIYRFVTVPWGVSEAIREAYIDVVKYCEYRIMLRLNISLNFILWVY